MTVHYLTGVVRDRAGNEARLGAPLVVDSGVPAGWPAAVLAWIQPMPPSRGEIVSANPTNWQTRANGLLPGQRLFLEPGVYGARGTTFNWTAQGTPDAPVSIMGVGGRPFIQGRIYMRGPWQRWASCVFDGPTGPVGGPGPNGEAILLNLDGSHLEVSECEVRGDQWHAGIGANNTTDYRILACYIHDNGGLNGDYRTTDSQWNTSHGCYISPSFYGLIANCLVEHNDAKGIMGRHNSHHILILNNTVVANGRHGVEAYAETQDWVLANNIVLHNGAKGGLGISTPASTAFFLSRNVLWKNGTGSTQWSTNGVVEGNLVADPRLVRPAIYTDHQDPAPNWDHRLLPDSPARGYADPRYLMPTNILGQSRVSPDCGAY